MAMYILIVIGSIILIYIIWMASLKGSYHIRRSRIMKQPIDNVWPMVYDLRNWVKWSPWLSAEPTAKINYKGREEGEGAMYDWQGELVGSGEMEHLKIKENKRIDQEVRFTKPWKSKSGVYWEFEKKEEGVEVTWGMKGKMPFLFRFMTRQMEPMIGMDYERGLKMMNELLEKGKVSSHIEIEGVVDSQEISYIGQRTSSKKDEISSSMQKIIGDLSTYAKEKQLEPVSVISVYHTFDFPKDDIDYTSGIEVPEDTPLDKEEFHKGKIPATKAVKVIFKGDYENLPNGWSAAFSYQRYKKLKMNKKIAPFEIYRNNPGEVPNPDDWITEIYIPVK
ncbi:GyrI-like domain-containing protein [Bacteroidota bacterium]